MECFVRSRSSTLKSMRSLIKLGKQRPPRAKSCDSGSDTRELLDRRDSSYATSNEPSRTSSMTSLDTNASDYESQLSANAAESQDAIAKPSKKPKPKVCLILRRSPEIVLSNPFLSHFLCRSAFSFITLTYRRSELHLPFRVATLCGKFECSRWEHSLELSEQLLTDIDPAVYCKIQYVLFLIEIPSASCFAFYFHHVETWSRR